ncbi:MAG: outer membrane beta-barrel protein [Thermoanaerobaculia bacterium]
MKPRIGALSLALCASASLAGAQVRSGTFEISPFYGYLFGGDFPSSGSELRVRVDDHGTYGVSLGYFANSTLQIEGRWARTKTGFVNRHDRRGRSNGSGNDDRRLADLTIDYFMGYATFHFGHRRWVPYVTAGMGAAMLDPGPSRIVCITAPCLPLEGSTETRFTTSLGGGVKFYANRHFGFRVDGRGYATYLNSNGDCNSSSHHSGRCSTNWLGNAEASGGLVIAF